ncbi:MAG: lipoyl(octanoyl) transferase LipB, partial [Acidobacteria bacterium]|nr:lipoyl(octanoyl) transferase LipB [Acidobacteriota bacterium]
QLVGYPIIDLSGWRKDVVAYVRALEEVLIRTASTVGVEAGRKAAPQQKRQFYTGVWVGEEKLAAIGVHISRWITSHGFALNVATDLGYFDLIVPCGISGKSVTSLERLCEPGGGGPSTPLRTGRWAGQKGTELMDQAKAAVVESFGEVFDRTMEIVEPDQWEAWLGAQPAATS